MDEESDTGSSDEEPVTAQIVLKSLEETWLNEKFCPEILPHQSDMVDCMLQQIQQMEENISKLEKGDFRIIIHRMELDRIRYIITSYLRTRLEKIEMFTNSILNDELKRSTDEQFLSDGEFKFARDYIASIEQHFELLALRHMPFNSSKLDRAKTLVAPSLDNHVFLRAKQPVSGIIVSSNRDNRDEEVDLEEGVLHIMQYAAVGALVRAGSVQLT